MSGKMSAEWWREYRRRRGEQLRAYNRDRRQTPLVRAQRHASEERRRRRVREAEAAKAVILTHPLLDAAAALVPLHATGSLLRFRSELTAEDARSEAVLAMLEGRDAALAVRAFRTAELRFAAIHRPLMETAAW